MKQSLDPPDRLRDVLEKLHQVNRELERLQYTANDDNEAVVLSGGKLLRTAKILAFVWDSRRSFIDNTLIYDPGWLILLNLKIAELTHKRYQVSAVCIDSGAPATTALRWISLLQSKSLVKRESDPHDRRRKYVVLTDGGSELMGRYLQNISTFFNAKNVFL